MRYYRKIGTVFSAMMLLIATMAITTEGQNRRGQHVGVKKPIVRIIRRPFFYPRFYDPFYDPYFYDPYLRAQRERYYLEEKLRGNQRELEKHRAEYMADGVITAKERRELNDDIRDVQEVRARLRKYNRDSD